MTKTTQVEPGFEISSRLWPYHPERARSRLKSVLPGSRSYAFTVSCKSAFPLTSRTSQCGLHASSSRGSIVTRQFIRTAIPRHHSRPTRGWGSLLLISPKDSESHWAVQCSHLGQGRSFSRVMPGEPSGSSCSSSPANTAATGDTCSPPSTHSLSG